MGPHLADHEAAREYAESLARGGAGEAVLIEERITGAEFTIQAISDGRTVVFPPSTYDYPYRYDGDEGPGTGGMGSLSMPDADAALHERGPLPAGVRDHRAGDRAPGRGRPPLQRRDEQRLLRHRRGRQGDRVQRPLRRPRVHEHHEPVRGELDRGDGAHQRRRLDAGRVPLRREASLVLYLVSPDYALRTGPAYEFTLDPARIEAEGRTCSSPRRWPPASTAIARSAPPARWRSASTAATLEQARERVAECAATVPVLEWRRDVGDEGYLDGLALSRGWSERAASRFVQDAPMIVERSTHPQFVSNTYLVADGEGGPAFFVDAGGPVEPLIEAAERLGLTPTHVLLTHHHFDHVSEVEALRERWPALRGADQPASSASCSRRGGRRRGRGAARIGDRGRRDAALRHARGAPAAHPGPHRRDALVPGQRRPSSGAPRRRPGSAPGGFPGGDAVVFTGDTLFKDSVGGVRAPGHTTYEDLRDSIMGTLMELPPEHRHLPRPRRPHHGRARVGVQPLHPRLARARPRGRRALHGAGEPATLVLLGADYDGGTRPGCAGRTAATTSCPGSQVSAGCLRRPAAR